MTNEQLNILTNEIERGFKQMEGGWENCKLILEVLVETVERDFENSDEYVPLIYDW